MNEIIRGTRGTGAPLRTAWSNEKQPAANSPHFFFPHCPTVSGTHLDSPTNAQTTPEYVSKPKTSLVLQPATQRNRNIWRFTNFVRLLFRNLYISSCTSCTGCTSRISPLYVRFSTFYAHDLFTPQLNETYWNFINVLSLTPRSLTVARSAKGRASIIIIIIIHGISAHVNGFRYVSVDVMPNELLYF